MPLNKMKRHAILHTLSIPERKLRPLNGLLLSHTCSLYYNWQLRAWSSANNGIAIPVQRPNLE